MRRPLFILVLGCLMLALKAPAQEPKRYYLGVGVEDYDHESLRKPEPLKYCVDDVTALGELLGRQGYEVTLLTDDAGKKDAKLLPTKANIERGVRRVLDGAKRGDSVVLAFAGHGLQFAGEKEAYFCPIDARPLKSRADSLVSTSSLYESMQASHASSRVLLVDACRNDPDPTRGRGLDAASAPPPEGVAAFFSCAAGQKAFENETLGHGVFFHFVIEGLAGKAKDEEDEVTLNTLANYVCKQVPREVEKQSPGRVQSPNLRFEQVGASPVLVKVTAPLVAESMPEMKKPEPADSDRSKTSATRSVGEVRDFTDLRLKFVYCPAGNFVMGSPSDEKDRSEDEDDMEGAGGSPVRVTLTKGFWLGQTEVTQKQWYEVMGTRPWRKEDGSLQDYVKEGDDIAASYISYEDAIAYCDKLTERERSAGRLKASERYTLPTEAQWEYACRAGTKTRFSFGDNEGQLGDYAWYGGFGDGNAKSEKYAHRVGQKKANPWGFRDMHGNVAEWCLDAYQDHLEGGRDPHVSDGTSRLFVLRGGSWVSSPGVLRSADRAWNGPSFRNYFGFRLSRTE